MGEPLVVEGDLAYPPKKHNLQKCSLQLHHGPDLGKAPMLEVSIISLWAVQVVDFRFGWVPASDDWENIFVISRFLEWPISFFHTGVAWEDLDCPKENRGQTSVPGKMINRKDDL